MKRHHERLSPLGQNREKSPHQTNTYPIRDETREVTNRGFLHETRRSLNIGNDGLKIEEAVNVTEYDSYESIPLFDSLCN